ncbi:MAG: sulfatase-like hydrolase/transferase [Pirellulaceae bacterium]|nr:sulfatase-like hydrolase/transferase [Pirellulaceae bacterium]
MRQLWSVVGFVALATLTGGLVAAESAAKPNVIVILVDDTGYADIGAYGGKDIPTPHIDSLASGGIRFTSGYVSCPYCSPTRAGLNTGRYQTRFGHEFNEPGPAQRESFGLPLSEKTIADRLKGQGYATGAIGKWHLGYVPDRRPMARGYDEFYGTLGNTPFYKPTNFVDSRKSADPQPMDDPQYYTTDAYAERAEQFITAHKDGPFFLYLPFNANHVPVQSPQKYLDRFPHIANPERKGYAAMFSALDDAIGRVLAAVRKIGQEENTLVFFLSDNGGPMTKMGQNGSNNAPLRGQKGDTWEGGIRVPFIVQWKGRLPAGKVVDEPVISLDILPTAVAAAGGKVPADWKLDGVNLLPYLEGKQSGSPHEALYWRFGPQLAVRQGNWKLVQAFDDSRSDQPGQPNKYHVVAQPQLHDLAADPGESKDLAAAHPDKAAALNALWVKWNAENQPPAWVPNPNPPVKKKQG